ncbi:MAG: hypothetical protein ACYC7D_01275 [Nitrososphaerales archaeon]
MPSEILRRYIKLTKVPRDHFDYRIAEQIAKKIFEETGTVTSRAVARKIHCSSIIISKCIMSDGSSFHDFFERAKEEKRFKAFQSIIENQPVINKLRLHIVSKKIRANIDYLRKQEKYIEFISWAKRIGGSVPCILFPNTAGHFDGLIF